MRVSHKMKQFFNENSREKGLEDFKFEFYRKLRVYNIGYIKGNFDNFLESLYTRDNSTYLNFLEDTKNVPYGFIKNNMDLVVNLINNNKTKEIATSCEMLEYQTALISRNIHSVHVTSVLSEKKKMLLNIEKCYLLMKSENEDNILRKAQRDFYDKYKSFENDPYLSDLFNKILDEFESKMLTALEMNKNKIEGISKQHTESKLNSHVVETIDTNKRDRYSFRRRVR